MDDLAKFSSLNIAGLLTASIGLTLFINSIYNLSYNFATGTIDCNDKQMGVQIFINKVQGGWMTLGIGAFIIGIIGIILLAIAKEDSYKTRYAAIGLIGLATLMVGEMIVSIVAFYGNSSQYQSNSIINICLSVIMFVVGMVLLLVPIKSPVIFD